MGRYQYVLLFEKFPKPRLLRVCSYLNLRVDEDGRSFDRWHRQGSPRVTDLARDVGRSQVAQHTTFEPEGTARCISQCFAPKRAPSAGDIPSAISLVPPKRAMVPLNI